MGLGLRPLLHTLMLSPCMLQEFGHMHVDEFVEHADKFQVCAFALLLSSVLAWWQWFSGFSVDWRSGVFN